MTSAAAAGAVLPEQADGQPAGRPWARLGNRAADVPMLVPVVVELALGGWKIGGPSLWRDEGDTLSASTRPVGRILALIHHQDAVHGLYYVLMHYLLAVIGTSPTALRLPSLIAAAAAAGVTAVLGRRLAAASGLPAPAITGMAAGLVLVALPRTTWYAQDARPYAIATLLAVVATYLLVRGWQDGQARWWAGYAIAMVLLGAMNLLAMVILLPHAIAMLAARRVPASASAAAPDPPGPGRNWRAGPSARAWRGFLLASALTVACLIPLAVLSDHQAKQIGWLARPGKGAILGLLADFGGVKTLVPLTFGLAALCLVLDLAAWRRPGCTLAKICLPWLVLPPAILIGISRVHAPIYDERYVLFCTPAMALLVAGGLALLARLIAPLVRPYRWLAVAAPVLIAAVICGLLIAPQQQIRLTAARPDNLAAVAAVLTAHQQPGDAVLYVPWSAKVTSQAYPAAFAGLRDIALLKSPDASATLRGLTVSGAELQSRFASVSRVWTVVMGGYGFRATYLGRVEHQLLGQLRLAGTWRLRTVRLYLYVRP